MLEAHIVKHRRDFTVDVHLELEPGRCFALFGASGSGGIAQPASTRQCPRRRARLTDRLLQLGDVVTTRVQLEIRKQLALRLRKFFHCWPLDKLSPQPRRGRSQRIALRRNVLYFDESFLFERSQHDSGFFYFLRQIRRGHRARIQQSEDLPRGIRRFRLVQVKLPCCVTPRFRQ